MYMHCILVTTPPPHPSPPPPPPPASKGLVINYREGRATKWENCGSETFCAPPSRQGNCAPPFNEWKLYMPPLQYG